MGKLGNDRVKLLKPSATMAMSVKANQLKAEGKDIINLAGGEPNFDTPQAVKDAAIQALNEGKTHYTMGGGVKELKTGIVRKLKRENDIEVNENQIILTPGGKYALFLTVQALLNPGDEVIVLAPTWVSYEPMVLANGAIPVFLELTEEDNFEITKEKLLEKTTDKTKMVIVCSPSNPTGHDLQEKEILALVDYIKETDIHILIDEMYEHLVYERKHLSLASHKEIADRVISVFGFSKSYAMTGWRLGYVIASDENISYMNKVYQHSITCVNSFVQYGAVVALECQKEIEEMRQAYLRRRNMFINALNEIKGVKAIMPEGAFYAWVAFEKEGLNDSEAICTYLLEEAGVAGAPGVAFSPSDKSHVRFSIASSDEDLAEAARRIKIAMEKD
jgi:aspartate aminotransferase